MTYWDNLSEDYHYEETFEQNMLAHFLAANAQSVFEASVGTGVIPTLLRKIGWQGKYLGSDYCELFLRAAKKHNPNEDFMEVDLGKPIALPDKSFDCSVVHHGLEYVYPYELALAELKRITRNYICLVFWVPPVMAENQIRFTEKGQWNVNQYAKKEFLATLKKLNLQIVVQAEITNPDQRNNYWYILKEN